MQAVNLLDGTMANVNRIQARSAADAISRHSVRHREVMPLQRPKWLPEEQWPFETFGIEHDGHRVAVTDTGAGPTLLFVHTGFWSFIWRGVLLRLTNSYRCVAVDAPGAGLSQRLPAELISLERSVAAVARVIEVLDLQDLVLVLHDLGGPVGIAGAATVAERVRGIAALNTFGWRPSNAVFRGMLVLMGSAFMREFDVFTGLLPRVTSNLFGAGRSMDAKSRAVLRAGIDREGLRAFHYYMRDALQCDDLYKGIDAALTGALRGLPFLSIFGERNDPFQFQRHWRHLFPHARQAVIARGNHFPMCDNPEMTATLIRSWHQEHVMTSILGNQPNALRHRKDQPC
jgi:pimeloyl-ACP methyl ester carboxylesterase